MNYKTKVYILYLAIILTIGGTLYGLGFYLNKKVNVFVTELAVKLTNEIGHPVTIAKVTTKWDWFFLKININDLVVLDKDSSVPLFMVNSIVGTVDTFNSIISFSPKFRNILFNSPRLIVQLDPIKGPMIMGLYGNDKVGEIDPTFMLRLLAMQRRVSVENGDLHIQGYNGVDLPLMKVKFDFKRKSSVEYNIIARGGIAAAIPPEFNMAINYHGKLDEYNRAMIDFDFKTSNIQVENFLDLYPRYNKGYIAGVFKDLNIMGVIQNGVFRYINTEFSVDKLNVSKDTDIVSGVGKIEFKPVKDKVSISISDLQLKNHQLFSQPVKIDSVRGDISSIFTGAQWDIISDNLAIKLAGMEISSSIKTKFKNNMLASLEIISKSRSANVAKVLKLLPDKKMHPGLVAWFNHAMLDGFIQSSNLKYTDKKLYWGLDFKQVDLKYAAEWPSVSGLDAILELEDGELSITATKANLLTNKVNNLTADFINDDGATYPLIMINGDLDASLEAGLEFLEKSPLKNNILDKIAAFKPSGGMHLDLDLELNLNDDINVIVNGDLELKQATLKLPNVDLTLNDINGSVNFTKDTVTSHNLNLRLFDQYAKADISLSADKTKGMQVNLTAPLYVEALKQSFPILNTPSINGHTTIAAHVQIPWDTINQGTVLSISTDLVGVSLDYPDPLHKLAADKWPLELKYFVKDTAEQSLYLKLPRRLEANLLLRDKKLAGGHIYLGSDKAADLKKDSLFISGKMESFDWDLWRPWLQGYNKSPIPIQVELFINKLNFRGEKYKSMLINYDSASNKLSLDNPIITGTILFTKDEDKIELRLSNLDLGSAQLKDNIFLQTIKEKNKKKQLPLIQFYCEKLHLNQKEYNKVNVQLLPRTYGYDITDFSMSNDNILLQAQGQWQMDSKESTQISGNAYTKNFGKVLTDWGYGNSMTKGAGELNFSLRWDGNPTKFDIFNLSGDSHIELRSGNLTGVNPGLGRIIGLLSIESIQRRLKLDFSDLLSKGYSFDKLVSDLKLQSGIISSENITINSPSARIELAGKTNLKKQDLDFTMYVIPKVSVGLPVAAAIAIGNPAVGAAIWLFDQASGSKIGEISKYKYKVTGTWSAPKIEEIVQKNQDKVKDTEKPDESSNEKK